jgi:hypothetical protein
MTVEHYAAKAAKFTAVVRVHPRFTDLSSGRSCGQPCDVG